MQPAGGSRLENVDRFLSVKLRNQSPNIEVPDIFNNDLLQPQLKIQENHYNMQNAMSKQAQTSQHSPVNLNYITPHRQQYLPVRGRRIHRDELIFKSAEGSNGHFKSMKRLAPNLSQKINMYHANKNQNMVNKMNIFELDNSAPEQYTKKAQALVNQYR